MKKQLKILIPIIAMLLIGGCGNIHAEEIESSSSSLITIDELNDYIDKEETFLAYIGTEDSELVSNIYSEIDSDYPLYELPVVGGYNGVYAFEKGLISKYDTLEECKTEEDKNIAIRSVLGSLISAHGFSNVFTDYEEVKDFINEGNDKFIVLVSRDSCPYCPKVNSVAMEINKGGYTDIPFIYFCSQEYINKIENGITDFSEWDSVKEIFGTDSVPYIGLYNNGEYSSLPTNIEELAEKLMKNNEKLPSSVKKPSVKKPSAFRKVDN